MKIRIDGFAIRGARERKAKSYYRPRYRRELRVILNADRLRNRADGYLNMTAITPGVSQLNPDVRRQRPR